MKIVYWLFFTLISLCGSSVAQPWNNPHPSSGAENVGYLAFINPPKTLDPARSYSVDETQFIAQIYEPPLQYAYLLRPYTLTILTATQMPVISYYNSQGLRLADDTDPKNIAYSVYDIYIKPGILYQPHPAFAKKKEGQYRYHDLKLANLKGINKLDDFKYTGTRELQAEDYVYEIKRLADPNVQSPIYGLMSQYIVGLKDLSLRLQAVNQQSFLDLRNYPLEGVRVIEPFHYQIKIYGFYPQFKYWLAMPFFAPIPWEAAYFYSQPGMAKKNITLDWYPVGTGPYVLQENNPNLQMVLSRNPNFHGELFPSAGEPGDAEKGYLQNSGKLMPFIDAFVYTLDRESIPRWNKFMQGYYDQSGVSADSFDQAIHVDKDNHATLTPELLQKGIRLAIAVEPSVFYIGFNMLDADIGGYSLAKQKLRQALAIAFDEEEFINIFLNGRGVPAQGPLPPGIFGYQTGAAGINPWVYYWKNNQPVRRSLRDAKQLLSEAGFARGRDPRTGQALLLNYDATSSGSPDDNAQYNWFRKQFAKLGIQLNIRATSYNRFQDKIRDGGVQIFEFGWQADYPDAENFLFLLFGPNSIVKSGGVNTTNYTNSQADKLFTEIADLPNGEIRQQKINQWLAIARRDTPWIWGFYPFNFSLYQPWMQPTKPNVMANNTLKYLRLDGPLRAKLRGQWNPPIIWPLWLLFFVLMVLILPQVVTYWLRERRPSIRRF